MIDKKILSEYYLDMTESPGANHELEAVKTLRSEIRTVLDGEVIDKVFALIKQSSPKIASQIETVSNAINEDGIDFLLTGHDDPIPDLGYLINAVLEDDIDQAYVGIDNYSESIKKARQRGIYHELKKLYYDEDQYPETDNLSVRLQEKQILEEGFQLYRGWVLPFMFTDF